jgi:hypothetical protein
VSLPSSSGIDGKSGAHWPHSFWTLSLPSGDLHYPHDKAAIKLLPYPSDIELLPLCAYKNGIFY